MTHCGATRLHFMVDAPAQCKRAGGQINQLHSLKVAVGRPGRVRHKDQTRLGQHAKRFLIEVGLAGGILLAQRHAAQQGRMRRILNVEQ